MTLKVHKAQLITSDTDSVPSRTIEMCLEIDPEGTDRPFKKDGEAIADALFEALPGGTIDYLLAELLNRKRSQFVVSYGDLKAELTAEYLKGQASMSRQIAGELRQLIGEHLKREAG